LPRVEIEIVPPEVEREPDAFECIGSETREVLERRTAAIVAVKLVYKRFARKDRERGGETEVLVGETVELPIERGSAGPGFLADTIVRRWQDHQPLNRLEAVYARDGLDLSRSTLCTWHGELGGDGQWRGPCSCWRQAAKRRRTRAKRAGWAGWAVRPKLPKVGPWPARKPPRRPPARAVTRVQRRCPQ
jgi:transposase